MPLRWRAEAGWEPSHWYEVGALRRPSDLSAVQMQAGYQNEGGDEEQRFHGSNGLRLPPR